MTAYLGNDCDGRPLYAGDRVTVVKTGNPRASYCLGAQCTVTGISPIHEGHALTDIPVPSDIPSHTGYWSVLPHCTRKLDPPADWEEVARVTGWRPEREEETV